MVRYQECGCNHLARARDLGLGLENLQPLRARQRQMSVKRSKQGSLKKNPGQCASQWKCYRENYGVNCC